MDETSETPVKRTGKRQRAAKDVVVNLFGDPVIEPPEDPDAKRPVNPTKGTEAHRTAPRKRKRMGRRFTELDNMVNSGEITMKEFVKLMDAEELARGQLRAKDGTFRGAPPKWVPAEFYQECVRELLKRGQNLYRSNFLVAIQAFTEIAANPDVSPSDRLKAAQYIWERVEGKVPDKVEIGGITEPWEQIIGGIVAEAEDENIARATAILNGHEVPEEKFGE